MITLRMLGIAVAILLGIPLAFGLAQLPIIVEGGEIVDASEDAAFAVTDIVLADPPQTYDRAAVYDWPEQLVEGHTVFLQILIPLIPNESQFTVDILGDISCQLHANASGPYFLGVPFPNRIHESRVECHAGQTVFVTPNPFYDSDETTGSYSYHTQMEPTGDEIPYVTPSGVAGIAREYTYTVISVDELGTATEKRVYAYSVKTVEPFLHTDGSVKRWYCPIPIARLEEMDVSHFDAYVAEKPDDVFLLME